MLKDSFQLQMLSQQNNIYLQSDYLKDEIHDLSLIQMSWNTEDKKKNIHGNIL